MHLHRLPLIGLAVSALAGGPVAGQRLLDLPVRTGAEPDVLVAGAAALFWNPARLAPPGARAEALLVNTRAPAASSLEGLALAGSYALDSASTVAAGYQHMGIDDIHRTTTSPLGDGESLVDVAEDVFTIAASRTVYDGFIVGARVDYARTSPIAGGDDVFELGVGAAFAPASPLNPTIAAALDAADTGTRWSAAVDLAPRLARWKDWLVHASWGVGGAAQFHGLAHRVAAGAAWHDRLQLSVGLDGEPGADGREWQPMAGARLRLSRYTVGIVREQLPNDFGAVHSFRFSVEF